MDYSADDIARALEAVCLVEKRCREAYNQILDACIKAIIEFHIAMMRVAEVAAQYTPPEPDESFEDELNRFVEECCFDGEDLTPRQYGERLSWGGHRRPYKRRKYSYIRVFERNLPYQRRAG